MLPRGDAEQIERLLSDYGLPTRLRPAPLDDLLAAMRSDKKALGGALRLVLPTAIGRVDIVPEADEAALTRALCDLGASRASVGRT
jgi:3-dehydroquinate synthetase